MGFPTTRRSLVLALAGESETDRARAFETMAEVYWRPLYTYARLSHARAPIDAEDLTQSFLAVVLEKDALAGYDASRGSFRTYLRTLFDRHVANEIKAMGRIKRGGGAVRIDFEDAESELGRHNGSENPDEAFQREWARSVFTLAVARLRERVAAGDFALFEACDLDDAHPSYRELSERFGIPVTTVTNRLAATRRRFREIVLYIVREATTTDREFRSEVRALLGVEV